MKKIVKIDFKNIKTKEDLHNLLREKLEFPNFYGMNWGAFWDSITGLVEMPENLSLLNWGYLKSVLPDDAKLMKEYLEEMKEQYPDIICSIEYV